MQTSKSIEHQGVVQSINTKMIKVSILSTSACSSCKVKGVCSVSDVEEKIIEIQNTNGNFEIGEQVKVFYQQILGFKALLLAYVYPFLLLFVTLIIVNYFTKNEAISGLVCLLILVPYYFVLFLFKNKLQQTFTFSIKKLNKK